MGIHWEFIIIFLKAQGKNGIQIYSKILETFPDDHPGYSTITRMHLTGIPRSTVYNIVTQSLGYEVHHLRWIPHSLNCQQKKIGLNFQSAC